jgi:YidC/Oxa1 family membrane protein insertase
VANGSRHFYSTFTGPAVYTERRSSTRSTFADIDKNKVDIAEGVQHGYVAMVQHYFASAWILGEGIKRELFARKVDNNLYAVGMIAAVDDGGARRHAGRRRHAVRRPEEEKKLEAMAPGLDLVKDYGWLTILAKPLYWLLDQHPRRSSATGAGRSWRWCC